MSDGHDINKPCINIIDCEAIFADRKRNIGVKNLSCKPKIFSFADCLSSFQFHMNSFVQLVVYQ